jgi:hypothetical protein
MNEEVFNFPGYKRDANQNNTKISSYHSEKNSKEQKQQMLARMQ